LNTGNILVNSPDGEIVGEGTLNTVNGIFTNQGRISPAGAGIGRLVIEGSASTFITSVLDFQVDGLTPDTLHDVLEIDGGTYSLSGSLAISGSYVPTPGQTVTVVEGTGGGSVAGSFNHRSGLDVDNAVVWTISTGPDVVLTAVATTMPGSDAPDQILGTGVTDIVVAGDGADSLEGFSGDDIVYGQAGDDTIEVSGSITAGFFASGGSGLDQLRFTDATINLVSDALQYDEFEVVSLRNGIGTQTLTLEHDSIVSIVDGLNILAGADNVLFVIGDPGDTVNLSGDLSNPTTNFERNGSGHFAAAGTTEEFDILRRSSTTTAFLGIDQDVRVIIDNDIGGGQILIGGSLGDPLTGTTFDDILEGRGGIDTLDGGFGNDTFVLTNNDIADRDIVTGGGGVDTIQIEEDVDFTGMNVGDDISGIERLDMRNGTIETLQLNLTELLDMGGDDGFVSFANSPNPAAFDSFLVDGDAGDTLIINGVNVTETPGGLGLNPGDVPGATLTSTIVENGENYYVLTVAGTLEVLIHEDLIPDGLQL
ncbi:MAG: hypothetical protein AAF525_18530, partial [Pseudomonadota bacterium]